MTATRGAATTIGAWLPNDWGRELDADEKARVRESDVDLLLIPENHDDWANCGAWKRTADEMDTAVYAGFEDDGWTLGLFYDPASGREQVYTKHSTSENIALERDDWTPGGYLHTLDLAGVTVGTTICHDHYLSPLMRYEGLHDATVLLNLSASPVVRRKWGEVLQARAIENGAYVVCTMHGRNPDGSESRTNKGHVFAFDPYGDQIEISELGRGRRCKPFETRPNNIYAFDVEPSRATRARRTLSRQDQRDAIDRVRENRFASSGSMDTTLDVGVGGGELILEFGGDESRIEIGTSGTVRIGGRTIWLESLEAREAFEPERLYESLLEVPGVENYRILIHNHWSSATEEFLDNVVEPVLRARCVEWCSPVLLTAGGHARGYQLANKHKDTHEIPRDRRGRFNFETKRAFGVESALKPVHGERERMRELANACSSSR